MKEVIDSGELGPLTALITHYSGTLFNRMSHYFDLLLRLNSDRPVEWVQAHLPNGDDAIEGDAIIQDPRGHGMFQFDNGVTAYVLESRKGGYNEHEAICETGVMTQVANGADWQLRRFDREGEPQQFPPFERASPTLRIIEDLVHSLDTGEPPCGGPRVARASTELIFAFIESHRLGGARVELPLRDCQLKFQVPYQPRPLFRGLKAHIKTLTPCVPLSLGKGEGEGNKSGGHPQTPTRGGCTLWTPSNEEFC